MKIVFLLLFLISGLTILGKERYGLDNIEKKGYSAMDEFADRMKAKGFIAVGSGGSGGVNIHKTFDLLFQTKEKMTIESARRLIVESTHEFLDCINKNKQLRPYLIQFPATIENVGLVISTTPKDSVQEPNIVSVMTIWDKIYYYSNDPDFDKYIILKEPFEEAEKIVKGQK